MGAWIAFLGDGMLAVFGAPQAHRKRPGARHLRRAGDAESGGETRPRYHLRHQYRRGLRGGIGSEQYQEVTVMGPVVNLAARLQFESGSGAGAGRRSRPFVIPAARLPSRISADR